MKSESSSTTTTMARISNHYYLAFCPQTHANTSQYFIKLVIS